MKKVFILIVGLMLTITSFAQKTVAVYVTASEGVSNETKRVLGSELVAAITKTADYIAVERTADFMAQVAKEQGNYEITDAALYDLGRKFGASNVCVADVTKFGDEYYIVARLLDIKTSKVWKTAKKYSTLKSLRELVEISEALANELFGSTKEFSTYAYGDNVDNNSFITKIENRGNFTKVTLKYVSVNSKQTLGIARNTYIEDMSTRQKYNLTDAANINIFDQNSNSGKLIGSGIWEYHLFFDRISEDVQNIAIVEPNGRKYNDIVLRPYGDENTFVFEDHTQNVYNNMLANANEMIREKGNLTIHKIGSSYYLGDRLLTKDEYKGFIEDCPEAWNKYKNGQIWNIVGLGAAAGGITLLVFAIPLIDIQKGAAAFTIVGSGVTALSIPAFFKGRNNKREAYKEYNKHCAKPATLSMGLTGNGVGVVLNF
ncbi:MAG: hypothetical protein IK004_07410 [Bacteroidales bacterium]|nr:hypothetical protein [Bacteroidales bacterium]